MKTELLSIMARLSDKQLIAQVIELARHEREATANLVAHLAEFGARKLYLGEGCATLFSYCTEGLQLSEHEAYLRITAARLSRRFPVILDKLESGAVNLTTLKLLRKVLTSENHARLLAAAEHKSKRHVEELVASVAPQPAVENWIRKLPAKQVEAAMPAAGSLFCAAFAAATSEAVTSATPGDGPAVAWPTAATRVDAAPEVATAAVATAAVIAPLAPELYKIQFTASAETHAKLRRAQDLMRHQIPNGDPAAIIDRALTMLVTHLEKTRLGPTNRPMRATGMRPDTTGPARDARPSRRRASRHVPAAVRRAVWERDRGRCAFMSADGKRCNERGFFEFHHVKPYGDGGEASLENIELRCRAHNEYEADLYFGPSNEAVRKAAIQTRNRQKPDDKPSVVRESPAPYGSRSSCPSKREFGLDRIWLRSEKRDRSGAPRASGGASQRDRHVSRQPCYGVGVASRARPERTRNAQTSAMQ